MFEIFDSHAHIYPQKIALKATTAVGDFYAADMAGDGTIEKLLSFGKEAGISRFVVHSVATCARQVESINRFILLSCAERPEFIGFMTLHPDMSEEEIDAEVSFCVERGIRGVKLHPDFQKFAIHSPEAKKIYRVVGERLPILFHTGDKRYKFSAPSYLAQIAKEFPKMRFIGAHFGGYSCWQQVVDAYRGCDNVWFDTSSSFGFFDDYAFLTDVMKTLGTDRFFFGSDYPMWNAKKEVERFLTLDLTDAQRERVFSGNLKDFLFLN